MRPLIFGETNTTQKIALNPFIVGPDAPPPPPLLLKGRVRRPKIESLGGTKFSARKGG